LPALPGRHDGEQFLRDFMEAFEVFVTRVLTVPTPEGFSATG
jgi:hypothetical protein